MKINNAHTPAWVDEAHTLISLTVDFEGIGSVPFSANPSDPEAHGRDLYARAVAGDFGVVAEYQSLTPTPEQQKQVQVSALQSQCKSEILAGFKSSALGSEFHYPSNPTDQTNLMGSVLESALPNPDDWTTPFWCADASGVWEFRQHTAAQIQQVGRDSKAAVVAAQLKLDAAVAALG